MRETPARGVPELIGSLIAAFLIYGVAGAVVGSIWVAATLGWSWWGPDLGFVAAGLVGACFALPAALALSRERRRELSTAQMVIFMPLLCVLAALGLVVWIVRVLW